MTSAQQAIQVAIEFLTANNITFAHVLFAHQRGIDDDMHTLPAEVEWEIYFEEGEETGFECSPLVVYVDKSLSKAWPMTRF